MHFYRRLKPIKAITFDLDDTLYDNYPVILKTTEESHRFLQAYHPSLRDFSTEAYQKLRDRLLAEEPEIYHDVTEWRRRTVEQAMLDVGLTLNEAREGSNKVMEVFAHWRSQISVPPETHVALAALAERVPLVAITNGNAARGPAWARQALPGYVSSGGAAAEYRSGKHSARRRRSHD